MMEFPVILKLTHPNDLNLKKKAEWFSEQPGVKVLTSHYESPSSQGVSQNIPTLYLTRNGTYLKIEETRLSFHPSMALIRLIQIIRGEKDRFLQATALQRGDVLLDATLGLATDALVAAWQVGDEGRIIGLEHSPILAALVRDGLYTLSHNPIPRIENPDKLKAWEALAQAAKRIEVHFGNHQEILSSYAACSVDEVYFDPMFRHTREKSASIRPLYHVSNTQRLRKETIIEACRVARRRVTLKERKGSEEFKRLGFSLHEGGKYSHVDYGIIQCREERF